ncbi:hypothetical protein [Polyangium sp. y55x31]|uniref:hypothetical protein n=1 Tax=Polyangium sp. y55x31 TaxID=3042688 RepID=UPI00248281B6|nr:hypothetical protein [Polyangium sp. y55x31]MDI1483003.1 hypothetical protein [Polyangium sp. y55x31]
MKRNACALALALTLASLPGCSSDEGTQPDPAPEPGPTVTDVRGDRYCEILVGDIEGSNILFDVYNTYQLNDCPEAAWQSVDAAAIKAEKQAVAVVLNGPRYWIMDEFSNSKVVDTTVETFGSLEMRVAGVLEMPLADAMSESAYVPRKVARTTTWVYKAGKLVYELVDPQGQIFDMQSYSVQKVAQTESSLAELGATLTLPAGWKFQARVLESDLEVTAVDGVATVVQDDHGNTYQLSQ